jgi:hypothetical protein
MIASTDNSAIYSYIPDTDYNGGDSFAFNASDGVSSAAEDASASVIIDPVPDLVDVSFPSLALTGVQYQYGSTINCFSNTEFDGIKA